MHPHGPPPPPAPRFRYGGLKLIDDTERRLLAQNLMERGGATAKPHPGIEYAGTVVDDAFSTVLQVLYTKVDEMAAIRARGGAEALGLGAGSGGGTAGGRGEAG